MALTRKFRETVGERLQADPKFRLELLRESIECLLAGDVETGKTLMRDYINATVGFEKLGSEVEKSPKSLMRMFSTSGNPQARNLFEIIGYLQKYEGVHFEVQTVR